MAHAEKCPVCNGKGEIFRAGDAGTNIGDTRSNNVCHGCNGKGWVEVGTEYPNPIHSGQSYSPEKLKITLPELVPYINNFGPKKEVL
jgi:DnaJ-class molecular chaperone